MVVTDFQRLCASGWENEKEIGKKFPLSFLEFAVSDYKENIRSSAVMECGISISEHEDNIDCGKFRISRIKSEKFGVPSAVRIDCKNENITLHGTFSFHSDDPGLKGIFEFKEVL